MKKLFEMVKEYGPFCVGLDPNIEKMDQKDLLDVSHIPFVYDAFCSRIMRSVKSLVKVVKFQSAYFEACGPEGLITLRHLISDAKKMGFYTILDAKRSDISTSALAYAKAAFDIYDADALTVVPFMGNKSVKTFVDYARKMDRQIFIVAYPTERSLYSAYAIDAIELAQTLGDENLHNGYGDVGVVVSGILPNNIDIYRKFAPRVFFLIPGMGTQGGKLEDQLPAFQENNGAILNYSRSILYADDPCQTVKDLLETWHGLHK